jgi:hypothetical protein
MVLAYSRSGHNDVLVSQSNDLALIVEYLKTQEHPYPHRFDARVCFLPQFDKIHMIASSFSSKKNKEIALLILS